MLCRSGLPCNRPAGYRRSYLSKKSGAVQQDIQGRVVDVFGNGVPNAVVHVRYHEPDKPVRRL